MKRILLDNIKFGYTKRTILFDNLTVDFKDKNDNGYIFALMGASGTGKTTILKLVLNLLKENEGKIITEPSFPIISYIPQEPVLFEHLTPKQNAAFFNSLKGYHKIFDTARFENLVDLMGIKEILDYKKDIKELSGGEKQRLAILRALSIRPDILLFDEPLTGLDAGSKSDILILIRSIVQQYKILVIYVTHHFSEAQLIADEIVYINKNENDIIKNVYKKDTQEFFRYPPVLESAISIAFPDFTVLPIKLIENNRIELRSVSIESVPNEENLFLFFTSESIKSSEKYGFKIISISESSQFYFFNIGESNFPVKALKGKIEKIGDFLQISGKCLIYNSLNIFQNCVQIENNQIIKKT